MVTINRNKIYSIIIDYLLFIIVLLIYFFGEISLNAMFCVSSVIYIVLLLLWFNQKKDKINYFTIILLLTYIYYFGQYLLYFFNIDISTQYTILNTFSVKSINSTALYLLMNVIVLHACVILFDKKVSNKMINYNSHNSDLLERNSFYYISFAILFISFICEIMVLLFKININISQGYSAALNATYNGAGNFSYIINFISTLYLPATFASLVSSRNKNSNKCVWILYIMYLIFYVLSGSRFEAAVSLMGILLLYHYYYRKLDWKKIGLIVLFALIILYCFSVMSNMRVISNYGKTSDYIEILKLAIERTNNNNFISSVISVAGMQILSVTAVFQNCPSNVSFSFGMYYLGGLIRVIPNIFGGDNPLITDSIDTIFRVYFTKTYGMGSSFIIEAYYNFSWFGIFMMVPFGWAISFLCRKMEEARLNKNANIILTYFIFYIASTAMFYVRSDARFIIREIVFYYFGFKVATWLFKGIFVKQKGTLKSIRR